MSDTPDPGPGEPAPGERRGTVATLLVLILLTMAGAAGGGYWLWQQVQASRAASERLEARWQARARALDERLAETAARQRERMQSQLETLRRELAAVSESLGALEMWAHAGGAEGVEPRTWSLEQARILLLTAAYHSSAQRRDEAVRALEAASAHLAAVRDPRLDPVRERLAADLEALRSSPDPDLGHIVAALSELAREARRLPLPPTPLPEERAPGASPSGGEAATGWQGLLDAVWRNAKALIVVRRVGEESSAGWLPEERRQRYARVPLALDGARLSALRRDTQAFHAGLRTAREWLLARLDAGTPRIQAMVQRIEALQSAALAENRTDPLAPLGTLRLLDRALGSSAPPSGARAR